MRTDAEIRNEAWRLLWKRNWFWKLLGASVLINMCAQAVLGFINGVVFQIGMLSILGFNGFLNFQAGKPLEAPELSAGIIAAVAVLFLFAIAVAILVRGIADYGTAAVLVRSANDRPDDWLGATFSGFKMPFQLAWLMLRMMLAYAIWAVPAALPIGMTIMFMENAITTINTPADAMPYVFALMAALTLFTAVLCIPFYRYRYLFRIKADHPDWTTSQCMRTCTDLVDGYKWRSFLHDCSYWRILLIPLVALLLIVAIAALVVPFAASSENPIAHKAIAIIAGVLFGLLGYLVLLASILVCATYISEGQTLLYRDIARERLPAR